MSTQTVESVCYLQALGDHLTDYLQSKWGSPCKDKFDAYMSNGQLIPMFKDMGSDTIVIGRFQYSAIFSIEDMPTHLVDPYVVMARVMAWTTDHDRERERHQLKPPSVDIDAYNNGQMADLEITMDFVESITAKRAPDGAAGDVSFAGKEWVIQPYVVYLAEKGEVLPNAFTTDH